MHTRLAVCARMKENKLQSTTFSLLNIRGAMDLCSLSHRPHSMASVRYSCFVTIFDVNAHEQYELVVVFPLTSRHKTSCDCCYKTGGFRWHTRWNVVQLKSRTTFVWLIVLFYTRGRSFITLMTLQRQLNSSVHVFI